ncbi:MAG: hypothetical protein LBT38_07395 [Deltaproteobacteria bacterium]|nr:hypothetical protein [Deltaproteobacteria bacterium]
MTNEYSSCGVLEDNTNPGELINLEEPPMWVYVGKPKENVNWKFIQDTPEEINKATRKAIQLNQCIHFQKSQNEASRTTVLPLADRLRTLDPNFCWRASIMFSAQKKKLAESLRALLPNFLGIL